MALKADLRQHYLEKRRNLSSDEVISLSKKICENFLRKFEVSEGDKVHIFLSIPKFQEVDTSFFIEYLKKNAAGIYVPKVAGDKLISVELTGETQMRKSKWGISEPVKSQDAAVKNYRYVITPLLYCDPSGNRVGYGKGYYDQFFSELQDGVIKIGVSFFEPVEFVQDTNEYDVKLDYLVLPDKILSFNGLL